MKLKYPHQGLDWGYNWYNAFALNWIGSSLLAKRPVKSWQQFPGAEERNGLFSKIRVQAIAID
ncbi:hypothetical protein MNBD_GAMMA17-1662 [hydrothermal vent metagenome]|uniref:Uncharacterized protein n=1 Tax=hydrothermal vent metagenome TaxID=652676 RepID=A0A3B0ZF95_9ZZZZ